MKRFNSKGRALSLIMLGAFVLSACGGGNGGPNLVGEDVQTPVVPAFMAGLNANSLNDYKGWWRANSQTELGNMSWVPMQPECGLAYAYDKMTESWAADLSAEGFAQSSGWLLANPDQGVGNAFVNDSEALIILEGRAFQSLGSDPDCTRPDIHDRVYLPVRLSLSSGQWQVDGASSVGAVVTISAQAGVRSQPLTSGLEMSEDEPSYYSPFRIARFRVTEENHERVQQWAQVSKVQSSQQLRLMWFRYDDLNPIFASMANAGGNCRTAAFYAFYGDEGGGCGAHLNQEDTTRITWLDDWGRQGGAGEQVSKSDSVLPGGLFGESWSDVNDTLTEMTSSSANYSSLRSRLRQQIESHGALTSSSPPAELGGWSFDPRRVFAIVASNGQNSYNATRDTLEGGDQQANTSGEPQYWLPYAGYVGPAGEERSITVTSSQTAQDLGMTEEEFYKQFSFLNFDGSPTRQMRYSIFSTSSQTASGTSGGLLFDQAPLTKFNISVVDALRGDNRGTYISDWVPTQFVGREGPDGSYRRSYNLIFEPGQALNAFILDLLYNAYTATFGAGVSALSRFDTGSLLAVPTLDQFEVDYYGPSGPVYKATTNIDALRGCQLSAARGGSLSPQEAPECFSENGLYTMWSMIRSLMMIFVLAYMAFYFVNQMTQWRKNRLQPLGFLVRVFIAFALLFTLDAVIKGMSILTAEVILITNSIGTAINGGEPYSYLWLFTGFLDTPARDYSILLMAVVALFAIVGLAVLALFTLLRLLFVVIMVVMSPIWVYSLVTDPEMRWFYSSLRLTLRMYLIPLITLTMILAFFAVMQLFGIGPSSPPVLLAFVSVALILVLAPVAWMSAHWVVKGPMSAVRAAIDNANKAAEDSEANAWLGGPANRGSVPLAEGVSARGNARASSSESEKVRELESRSGGTERVAGGVESERLGSSGGGATAANEESSGPSARLGGADASRRALTGGDTEMRPKPKALSLFGDAVLGLAGGGLSSNAFQLRSSIALAERDINRKEAVLASAEAAADRGEPGAAERVAELRDDLDRSKSHLRGLRARLSGQPFEEPARHQVAAGQQSTLFNGEDKPASASSGGAPRGGRLRRLGAISGRVAMGGGAAYGGGLTNFGLAAGNFSKKAVFRDVANLRHEFGVPGKEMLSAITSGRLVDSGWNEASGGGRFLARVTSPRKTASEVGSYFAKPTAATSIRSAIGSGAEQLRSRRPDFSSSERRSPASGSSTNAGGELSNETMGQLGKPEDWR